MKKGISVLSILMMSMVLVFTACNKDDEKTIKDDAVYEIDFKSLEPEVIVQGSGEDKDYGRVVVEPIVRNPDCDNEPVSGIVEFYRNDLMVFSVNFGDGECDGVATVTWIKEDGTTNSKVVDVWRVFKKRHQNHMKRCFQLVLPVSFELPDGSIFIVESNDDWMELREWCQNNSGFEEKPLMLFPVEIIYRDGTVQTINTEEEMRAAREECTGDRLTEVIVEELVTSEECDDEIVSGLIEYYNSNDIWVASVDFGDGECDGIATKCWINKDQELECKDFDVSHWHSGHGNHNGPHN